MFVEGKVFGFIRIYILGLLYMYKIYGFMDIIKVFIVIKLLEGVVR